MNFEQALQRLADSYAAQGYQVIVRPKPDDLPLFAKDFKIEIVGERGSEGVLIAVKKNRDEMAADSEMTRYAEITGAQQGWRFDFAIVEPEERRAREFRGEQELSSEGIDRALSEASAMVGAGFLRPAVVSAWAAFEAAMRKRLRAAGERPSWETSPRDLLNELYSSGVLTADEFRTLETMSRQRNQIVHGFTSTTADAAGVEYVSNVARRLVDESQRAAQPV